MSDDRDDATPTADTPPAAPSGVRRVGTLSEDATREDGGRITTGVLAADATSRVELRRRRRWLVGGGVLGLVLVLAYLLGSTLAADQRRQDARDRVAQQAAEAAFAQVVVDRAEAYEAPAAAVAVDSTALRAALEEHLAASRRSIPELVEVVELTSASLDETATTVDELTARELPPLDGLVTEQDAAVVLGELAQLRIEATAMVEEIGAVTDDARGWSSAVADVDAALTAHADAVVAKPTGTSPDELAAGWRSEVAPLEQLVAAAERAAAVPGLAAWAEAHRAYAEGTLAFVDEAVALLEAGETERYNQLFVGTFGEEDPFGFVAAARAGAEEALASTPLPEVAALGEHAAIVDDQLRAVETAVITTFGQP